MEKIYVLVNKYPNDIEPNTSVFVQQLVWSFADLGYDCNVICPLPVNFNIKYFKFPNIRKETNENNKTITIYHPKYFSLGQKAGLFRKLRVKLTTFFYTLAVDKILKKEHNNNFILYSHFICPSGVCAALLGKKYNVRSFFAHGEAIYAGDLKYGNKYLAKVFDNISGVIAVSSQNQKYLTDAKVVEKSKIKVFPNGYRKERFYPMSKEEARKHFNWPKDKYIVGFCGSFDERKGVLRLESAVDNLDDVYFACAGKGELVPTSKKCIWKSPVNNKDLNYFYNAIDVFALPTQNEGCCNAIVEAVACGCPVISSDREFNVDILNSENAILIDPNSVDELSKAIKYLKDNGKEREKMSKVSLKKAKDLTLDKRAKNIINFINKS